MIINSKNEMPNGWEWTTLENIADILDSQRVPVNAKERENRQGEVPYYGATGQVGFIDDYIFDEELVLLGEDGAPFFDPSKQKAYIVRGKSWVNNHAHVLRTKAGIPSSYLKYYLDIVDYHGFVTGTTRAKLNQKAMRQIPVPIAPFEQQKRIVAEIEKQFSRLDEAVANLKRVKANLKRYKAAVLKAAVEGKLTEEWRKQHPDVEPAVEFLRRVKPGYKAQNSKDSEVSSTWCVASLEQLTTYITSGSRGWAKYYSEAGDIFIRAQNIKTDKLLLDDFAYVQLPDRAEGQRTLVQFSDLLVTITGANVTKAALVDLDLGGNAYVNQHVALARPVDVSLAQFLYLWVVCPAYGRRCLEKAAYGAGKPGLNLTNLRELTVVLPPIAEQQVIVQEVEKHTSLANEIEKAVDKNLQRAQRLRQAVLRKAFTGNL